MIFDYGVKKLECFSNILIFLEFIYFQLHHEIAALGISSIMIYERGRPAVSCSFYERKQLLLSACLSHHNSVRLSVCLSHG